MRKYLVALGILGLLINIAFAVENKQFTIKGFYNLSSMLNLQTNNSSFNGSNVDISIDYAISLDSGFGIGIETVITKIKENIEIIGGGNWSFLRAGNDVDAKGTAKYSGQKENLTSDADSDDAEDIKIDVKSIYAKARYLFTPEDSTSFYVSGKTAYNIIDTSASSDELKLDNNFGLGFSVGVIYENDFDIELAIDNITGATKFDQSVNYITDSMKGAYSLTNTSISIGYRF